MEDLLPVVLGATLNDILTDQKFSLAALVSSGLSMAVQTGFRLKREAARDIALEELRRGEVDLSQVDMAETASICLRYIRAAHEGAARLNLRLMAKVIAGQAHQGVLYADEFLRFADILASLRREEVVLLSVWQRHWLAPDLQAFSNHDRMNEARQRLVSELVPSMFQDEIELIAVEASIVRTGFVVSTATYGAVIYQPTKSFTRLVSLASLDTALKSEPA